MFLPAVSPNRLKMAHKFSTQRYPSKFFIEIYFLSIKIKMVNPLLARLLFNARA